VAYIFGHGNQGGYKVGKMIKIIDKIISGMAKDITIFIEKITFKIMGKNDEK